MIEAQRMGVHDYVARHPAVPEASGWGSTKEEAVGRLREVLVKLGVRVEM